MLPGSLHEEDEGTSTSGEGRIIKINAAVTPPGEARRDWEILLDIAERLGKSEYFPYTNTEEIFDELCRASTGGTADYTGATWQRIEDEMGLFWPIPEAGHPGTPRLYEGGKFFHPDGKARFHSVPYKPSAEVVDADYPVLLTTGRVVSQYLSGTQTRRIAALVDQYPEPLCEMHPNLAEPLGIAEGDLVTVTSRRGTITLPSHVVNTIGPTPCSSRTTGPATRPRTSSPIVLSTHCRRCPSSRSRPFASNAPADTSTPSMLATSNCTGSGHEPGTIRHRRSPGVRDRPEPLHRL